MTCVYLYHGCANMELETLDSKVDRGLTSIINGDFKHSSIDSYKRKAKLDMVFSHLRISDVQGAVLELSDHLRIDFEGDTCAIRHCFGHGYRS